MRQSAAGILAARDRHVDAPRIVAHEPNIGAAARRGPRADPGDAVFDGERRPGARLLLARRGEAALQVTQIIADKTLAAVDHHLRRERPLFAERPLIGLLPRGIVRAA